VHEVGVDGRHVRMELFSPDHLGDACARLYQRFAERQPEGFERSRAMTVAQIFTWDGPVELNRIERAIQSAYTPSSRIIDHRVLGLWSTRNLEEQRQHLRLQLEQAPDLTARLEDILALDIRATVVLSNHFGTSRESGGAFENRICTLFVF